jgi:hypothetical protein
MRYSRRAADEAGITLFDAADMYHISALTVLREGVVRRQEHDVTVRIVDHRGVRTRGPLRRGEAMSDL